MQNHITPAASRAQEISPSVESVKMTRTLARHLQLAEFAIIPLPDLRHIIKVNDVFPCAECGAPICVVAFEGRPGSRVVDANPIYHSTTWTADVLLHHDCEVFPLHGTDGLRHVLAVTQMLGTTFRTGCLAQVPRASNCSLCGRLITCVKIGDDRPGWYEVERRSNGQQLLAHLSEPHECLAAGKRGEVHQ